MSGNRVLGMAILILALVIVVVPQFNNCSYEGKTLELTGGKTVPMKCLWTARAELVTGISLMAVGAMMAVNRRKENLRNLSIMGLVLGIFVILLPTSLIGVCQSAMNCNIVMRPTMLAAGTLVSSGSIIGLIASFRAR